MQRSRRVNLQSSNVNWNSKLPSFNVTNRMLNLDKPNLDKLNLDKLNLDKLNRDKLSRDKLSRDSPGQPSNSDRTTTLRRRPKIPFVSNSRLRVKLPSWLRNRPIRWESNRKPQRTRANLLGRRRKQVDRRSVGKLAQPASPRNGRRNQLRRLKTNWVNLTERTRTKT